MHSLRLFSILIFFFACFCQSKAEGKADSLLKVLKVAAEDTAKVNTLNAIAFETRNSNPTKAMEYAQEALTLATKLNDDRGRGIAYIQIATLDVNRGNPSRAIEYAYKALPSVRKYNDKFNESRVFNTIGEAYRYMDKYKVALKFYIVALKIRESSGDDAGMANVINNIAIIQFNLGNYPESVRQHLQALKIRESKNDLTGIAGSLNNLALVYAKQGNYPEALKCHLRALKIRKEKGDKRGMASSYTNIANIQRVKHLLKEATENYKSALKLFDELDDRNSIAGAYNNIGSILQIEADSLYKVNEEAAARNKIMEALSYYTHADKLFREIGSNNGAIVICENLGNANKSIHNYQEARKYFESGLEIAKKISSPEDVKNFYGDLSLIDSLTGDYKGAFENYKMYILTEKSLLNEENTKKTVQQQMQYEFDKKEIETRAEQTKKDAVASSEHQRQVVILAFVSGVLILTVFFAVILLRSLRLTKKQKRIIEEQKILVEEKQKEILDSIHYAKRIQQALLPTEKYMDKILRSLRRN